MLAAVGSALTVAKATAILTAATASIITAIELGTAGAATLYAGATVAYGVNSLKGKSFKKSVSCKYLPSITFCPTI